MKKTLLMAVALAWSSVGFGIDKNELVAQIYQQAKGTRGGQLLDLHKQYLEAQGFKGGDANSRSVAIRTTSTTMLNEPYPSYSVPEELEMLPKYGQVIVHERYSRKMPRRPGLLGNPWEEVTIVLVVDYKDQNKFTVGEIRLQMGIAIPEGNSSSAGSK